MVRRRHAYLRSLRYLAFRRYATICELSAFRFQRGAGVVKRQTQRT